MRLYPIAILLLLCLFGSSYTNSLSAQSKTKASADFVYLPEKGEDQYNQRITHKTIPLNTDSFIILSRQAADRYTVEKYSSDLKRAWQATISLDASETVEAYFKSTDAAIIVTRKANENNQQLHGHQISLQTGQKQDAVLLLEAPAKGRRLSIAHSPDGSKLLAYRYLTDNNHQIKDISGTLYDSRLQKIADTKYDLSDVHGILTADVKVSNTGEQFICLISDNMNRLTVRQYTPGNKAAKVMSVLVGGIFNGLKVYIIDSKFELMPNNTLYGAVLTAEEQSGKYYSMKAVKFNFEANDMVFAEEFRFTQAYVDKVTAVDKNATSKRLEDIYLSDLLLSENGKLTVVAEKKYTSGGKNAPYFAEELHLFTYDEYMGTAWSSVLLKQQQAPADEAFSGISYRINVSNNNIHLLTLEELKGKYDLYLRQIDTKTGKTTAPMAVGLNVASDKNLAYVKDFTAWLTDKNIITIVRPSKKAAGLRLSHIQLK